MCNIEPSWADPEATITKLGKVNVIHVFVYVRVYLE